MCSNKPFFAVGRCDDRDRHGNVPSVESEAMKIDRSGMLDESTVSQPVT